MILSAIILFFLTLGTKLFIDVKRWKGDNYNINHSKEWLYVAIALAPVCLVMVLDSKMDIAFSIVDSLLFLAFLFWFLFDGLFNVLRKFNWWKVGTPDSNEAKTDKFLSGFKPLQQHLIKLIPLTVFLILYLIWLK